MRRTGYAVASLIVLCASAFACGTERWAVKTLSDPDVRLIGRTSKSTTISFLITLPHPTPQQLHQKEASRFRPTETTIFIVKALLLGYHREKDEDFHLVLADPDHPNRTMIAEIPAPDCVKDASFGKVLQGMRDSLVQAYGSPGPRTARLPQPIPILIRGEGFYDFRHGQDGVAPNAIELHPVLGLKLSAPH